VADDEGKLEPRAQYLAQNSPNPFGSSTTISYSLRARQAVTVTVYDIRGALVREVVKETVSAGVHRVVWDGRDARGNAVASGVYFCRMDAAEFSETRRMVLLR
jgi:flagellar hook assembly protein FlgD